MENRVLEQNPDLRYTFFYNKSDLTDEEAVESKVRAIENFFMTEIQIGRRRNKNNKIVFVSNPGLLSLPPGY